MSPIVFPCYAPADRDAAASIAAFLENGADVRVLLDEGELRPGEDLVQKARQGCAADIVLVLFSRHSLPSPWPRAKWEGAMQTEPAELHVRVAFLKCDDCVPPRVLMPQFEFAGLPLASLRQLKRWIRNGSYTKAPLHHPELAENVEELGLAIADRPGVARVDRFLAAAEFTRMFRQDFDDVLHLECGGRSLAALAGDLASQAGLRLGGDLESNLAELRRCFAGRRLLVWLEGPSQEEAAAFTMEGRGSTLISTAPREEAPREEDSLRSIQFRLRNPETASDWESICRLARLGARLATAEGRTAECFEILLQWHELAKVQADRRAGEESTREIVWILEGWDRFEEARRWEQERATCYDDQIALPIGLSVPPPSVLASPVELPEDKTPKWVKLSGPDQLRLF